MTDDKKNNDVVEESGVEETETPHFDQSGDSEDYDVATQSEDDSGDDEPRGPNVLQRVWASYKARKKITIPATVFLLIVVTFVIPTTRYGVLGLVLKKDVYLKLIDSQTNVPVSGVEVSLRGRTAKTDGEGKAKLSGVRVGKGELKASKKYYKDTTNFVLTGLKTKPIDVRIEATGRQVPVHIVNKISGENVAGVSIIVAGTEAQTDQNGETTLVLPPSQQKAEAKLSKDGYNQQTMSVTINNATVKANTFSITAVGSVYFLSKQTGKIDVVKTNLDGSNRQTVLAGTGSEEDGNTILLASRDWKFLVLLSRREGASSRLYLINTSTDTLTEIDSGDASFGLVGWSGHSFVYSVYRNNVPIWEPKTSALKTYNADSLQLLTIDETNAEGNGSNDYVNEVISNVHILKDTLIYTKNWNASYYSVYRLAGKRIGIYTTKPSGSGKQTVKDFDAGASAYFSSTLIKPNAMYFGLYNNGSQNFFEYNNGKITESNKITSDTLNKFYPTFVISPDGNTTFWYEPRDGKNTLFLGNQEGENSKQLTSLSEYVPYGWYGDDYLLVSRNGSELFIQSAKTTIKTSQALKISDYHKPDRSFLGYGYGYGAF